MSDMFGEGIDPSEMEETDTATFEAEVRIPKRGKESKDSMDVPVENAGDIPLFVNADKRGLRSVSYIKLIKLDQPGAGYKGNIPLSSTLETIAQLYGDGLYTIEACNQKHVVLRREENIRIAMSDKKETVIGQQKQIGTNGVDAKDHHINKLITEIASTRARDKELSDKAISQITEQGDRFVTLVTKTTESAAQRDREHMAGVNKGQQDFFANMMQAQNQMFQQTMALMMASHSQTMQILQASSERDREMNNPLAMVQVLMQGLKMGREMEGDDTPDWLKAVGMAKDTIGSLATLANIKGMPSKIPVVSNPVLPPTANKTEKKVDKKPTKRVLSDEELVEVVRLKKTLSEQGMDLETVAKQARLYYQKNGESEDSSQSSDETPEQTDSSDVAGEDNNNSSTAED